MLWICIFGLHFLRRTGVHFAGKCSKVPAPIHRRSLGMKLYFSPGACSLSPHIVLRESGLPFDLVQVDVRAKKLKDGGDFLETNPKGQIPTLELDDGDRLTEGSAIVQYI